MVSQIPMAKGAFWGADEPSRGSAALLGVSRFSSETLLGARRFWATALLGVRRLCGHVTPEGIFQSPMLRRIRPPARI